MSTAVQIIEAIAPKLYADSNRSLYLSLARDRTDRRFFGINTEKAVALRAAHEYTLDQRTLGEGGSVSSKKEGQLSVSYDNGGAQSAGADLGQTSYGRRLRMLIRSSGPGIAVTGGRTLT